MPFLDEALRQRLRLDTLGMGAIDDLVVDVGEVLDVPHLVAAMLEVAADHVERHQGHSMADMCAVVGRHPADVHADLPWLDRSQRLLAPRKRVVDMNIRGRRFGLGPRLVRCHAAVSSLVRRNAGSRVYREGQRGSWSAWACSISRTRASSSSIRCMSEIIVSRSGSGRCSSRRVSPDAGSRQETARAGVPTAVVCGGTSLSTTEPAPTRAPSPIVTAPSTEAPTPMTASSSTVGCRLPRCFPVPPSVTPWYIVTSSPTEAVSPMTTPMPWSMKTPWPILAPGWISIPVIARLKWDRRRAGNRSPLRHSQCATRWRTMAWSPEDVRIASTVEREAGSRSRMARISLENIAAGPFTGADCSGRSRGRDYPQRWRLSGAPITPLGTGAMASAPRATALGDPMAKWRAPHWCRNSHQLVRHLGRALLLLRGG